MSEMVERVANALIERFKMRIAAHADAPFEQTKVEIPAREIWVDYAKAAIGAMRDPTEEMRTALCKACSTDCFAGCDVGGVWDAGIDEALK